MNGLPIFISDLAYTDREMDDYDRLAWKRRGYAAKLPLDWTLVIEIGAGVALLSGLLAVFAGAASPENGAIVAILIFVGFSAGIWTADVVTNRRRHKAWIKYRETQRTRLKDVSILVTSRGIFTRGLNARGFFARAAITEITHQRNLVLIWTQWKSAITIPDRLLTAEQLTALLSYLKS